MSSYLVTGVSRGLGFEFIRQLTQDPKNTVIGLVRNKTETDKRVASELGSPKNLHILEADLVDYAALKATVPQVSQLTGGSLDIIIANAGLVSTFSKWDPLSAYADQPAELEQDLIDSFRVNVVGNIHLFNLYMPLILRGKAKKVITITSGMADMDLVREYEVDWSAPYAISKAATNAAVAKFGAEYGRQGVLFTAICPGLVDTGNTNNLTEEETGKLMKQAARFAKYAPHFKGPATPEESVKDVLHLIDEASLETGYGGAYVSHLGKGKPWL